MFQKSNYNDKINDLERCIDRLKAHVQQLQSLQEDALHILRHQVAQLAEQQSVDPEAIRQGSPYASIHSNELDNYRNKYPDTLLLDVRTDEEWNLGHIDGAMHIEVGQLESRLGQIPNHKHQIIAICARGARSATACKILFRHGYTQMVNVQGGMMDYPGDITIAQIEPLSIDGLPGDIELLQQVARFFDQKVRPSLKRDGGDLKFHGIENNIVKVNMVGACGGCGSRQYTVNEGIKKALIAEIPQIQGIEDV